MRKHRALLSLKALLWAHLSFAQEAIPPDFDLLIKKGSDLLLAKKYDDARAYFELARKIQPNSSNTYAGLGFALKALGNCGEAIPHFNTYLQRTPNGDQTKQVRDAKKECETANARLVLQTEPSDASVTLDPPGSISLGRTPLTTELPAGVHTLEISKQGYPTISFTLDFQPGQSYELPIVSLQDTGGQGSGPRSLVKFSAAFSLGAGKFLGDNALGGKISAGGGTDLLLGVRYRVNLGARVAFGTFSVDRAGAGVDTTTMFAIHAGAERDVGQSAVARLGVEIEVGALLHGVAGQQEFFLPVRLAPTARFRISGPQSLVLQLAGFSLNAFTLDGGALDTFTMLDILSLGYERTF